MAPGLLQPFCFKTKGLIVIFPQILHNVYRFHLLQLSPINKILMVVIPAKAGIRFLEEWIPACAGMTYFGLGTTHLVDLLAAGVIVEQEKVRPLRN